MIIGEPRVLVHHDSADLVGLWTLVLKQLWAPGEGEDYDSAKPGVPGASGGLNLVGDQTVREGGAYRTYWTFRGVRGDGKGVTFKDRAASYDSEFKPGFAQVDIKLLPNIQKLMDKYGGYIDPGSGEIEFPPTIPNDNAGGLVVNPNSGDPNPMYGYKDWLRMEGIYTHRYLSFTTPSQKAVGSIIETADLPGKRKPKDIDDDRDWLVAPIPFIDHGVVCEVVETFWLSGQGGWPRAIYVEGVQV